MKETKREWSKTINKYYPVETGDIQPFLDPGVYFPRFPAMSPMYYERVKNDFQFPYKIYGLRSTLTDRIPRLWNNTEGNIGILLNGIKGTGKSVTAQIISNKMIENFDMPVIIIDEPYDNLGNLLMNIRQDVVVFIDEFEKVFSNQNEDYRQDLSGNILSIMDGAISSEFRRLFIFTTNEKYINENLLQRPGRIRYVVEFNDLPLKDITEIVDDLLKYPEHKEDVISFIATLEQITVDIVKAIVQEVNIFNQSPDKFKDIFNIEEKSTSYNVTRDGKAFDTFARVSPTNIFEKKYQKGSQNIYVNSEYIGILDSVDKETKTVRVKEDDNKIHEYCFTLTKTYHESFKNSEFAF